MYRSCLQKNEIRHKCRTKESALSHISWFCNKFHCVTTPFRSHSPNSAEYETPGAFLSLYWSPGSDVSDVETPVMPDWRRLVPTTSGPRPRRRPAGWPTLRWGRTTARSLLLLPESCLTLPGVQNGWPKWLAKMVGQWRDFLPQSESSY